MRALRAGVRAVLLGASLALVVAPPASAGPATRVGNAITVDMGFQFDGRAASNVKFFATGPDFDTTSATLINFGEGSLTAGPGCTQDGPNRVFCGLYPSVTSVTMMGGAGNDKLEVLVAFDDTSPPASTLRGDAGADTLIGGNGRSLLDGGSGDDRIGGFSTSSGSPLERGNDTLEGDAGNDKLIGGEGNDSLDGGGGDDVASYTPIPVCCPNSPVRAVRASLATGSATGAAAGTDTLRRLENLVGTPKNDVLIGDGGGNRLKGRFGKDRLIGRAGGDELFGGQKADRLKGGAGGDELFARDRRRDRVGGGPGRDIGHVDPIDLVFGVELL